MTRLRVHGHEELAAASVAEAIAVLETRRIEAVASDDSNLLAYCRRRFPDLRFVLVRR
ncbi:MAG TPA: hypothetical protein VN770_06510 [Gaiellaceae bacterium]|nr:hypothetical protein [Gaiellaceae bacterium]